MKLANLQWLSFRFTCVSDNRLKCLSQTPNLKTLYLDHCSNLSEEGIAHLRRLKSLEKLGLSNMRLSSQSMEVLASLPRLRWLDLSHSQFSDSTVAQLAKCESLEFVDLSFTSTALWWVSRLKRKLPNLHVEQIQLPVSTSCGDVSVEKDVLAYDLLSLVQPPLDIWPIEYPKIIKLKPVLTREEIEQCVRGQESGGIGCGVGTFQGTTCGYCCRSYFVHLSGFEVKQFVSLGYVETKGQEPVLTTFSGPGFSYQREGERLVRQEDKSD